MPEGSRDQAHGLRKIFRPCAFAAFVVAGATLQRGPAALALACGLSSLGRSVLLIDLDASLPPELDGQGPAMSLDDVLEARCPLAQAVSRLDLRSATIAGGSAVDALLRDGSPGLARLAEVLSGAGHGLRADTVVFSTDNARLPALIDWIGPQCRPVLASDTAPAALTATYATIKSLAGAAGIGECDVIASGPGGALASASVDRLARTAARFLPVEVRRLVTLDAAEFNALLQASRDRDRARVTALRARLGRALAGPLAARWPELLSTVPAPASASAPDARRSTPNAAAHRQQLPA